MKPRAWSCRSDSLVDFQAFFSQTKTWRETSVNDGQATIGMWLQTTDQLKINCEV